MRLLKRLFLSFWLITIGLLVSSLFKNEIEIKLLSVFIQYFFTLVIIPVVLVYYTRSNKLLLVYLRGLLVMILIGLFFQVFFNNFYLFLYRSGVFIGNQRFGSFLGSNALAKTIATMIPVLFLLFQQNYISKYSLYCCGSVLFYTLLKTASFGGLFASIISILLIFSLVRGFKYKLRITLLFIFTLISIAALVRLNFLNPDVFLTRVFYTIKNTEYDEFGSFQMKKDIMKEAIDYIKINPLIGIGTGQFLANNQFSQTVHNTYLLMWVEGGIISLLGILYLFLGELIFSFSNFITKNKSRNEIAIFTFTLVFMINLITSTHIYQGYRIVPLVIIWLSHNWKENTLSEIRNP